ncbi:transcriptional activator of ethanol catabolism AlcS [Aspergillus clavatus NRRL 1]|uniref:GPR1/FUN34/YaaH-class plasma membrane protein n=1 Tax=Aspergillus clavatus (strain ATCC 1007 / CBS 513.65 / DSM 816 / NCTC 3887 / NRRL 1 / QM 1276 / 107) TaxID=344612 RepID=A1CGE5_ASPCL|nr:uncharacterized protein ACLA_066610 [Aspergillus clavatus NRRL 1]EAW11025.1 hypothetical protein ACLA_066610 [Aspergillus clavatus NRRL 1]
MSGEVSLQSHEESIIRDKAAMHSLTPVPTSVTLSAEQFEKLYLSPLTQRQGALSKQMGNPTPLALGGFVITTTPVSCCLMGWAGASGAGIAFTGPIIFLGGGLLVLTSILEFILGNTFPCVVFGTIGAFWFAFGSTMLPAFNAAGCSILGLNDRHGSRTRGPRVPKHIRSVLSLTFEAQSSLTEPAFLFISMAVLMVIFMICATRTNVVYVVIFATLIIVFVLLSGAYWRLGVADATAGNRMVVGAGAALFLASLLGFYLLIAQLFDSVGFPVRLPVGDLTSLWDRRLKSQGEDPEYGAGTGGK